MTSAVAIVMLGRSGAPRADEGCRGDFAPGVVLARFGTALAAGRYPTALKTVGQVSELGVAAVHVPVGQECQAVQALRQNPSVVFAELDYVVRASGVITPNDPGWASQWGPGQIEAPAAWQVTTGTNELVVAVVDSGITAGHPDLAGQLWTNPGEIPGNDVDDDGNGQIDDYHGWRFYHRFDGSTYVPDEDGSIGDGFGHGTHTAGIIAAGFNNGVGVAGVAGGSRLMTVRVLDKWGNGFYSDIARGIIYASDNGAQVINLSLGGPTPSQVLQAAIDYAHERGVLVVAAAGNDGSAVDYPAACEHVLAVAATNQSDARPSFSSHGPQVDVAAPGVDIYSTWPWLDGYFAKSGTSMAAPHVSGVAALLWSERPGLSVVQVAEAITSTAVDVNSGVYAGWDEYLGWGRVDARQALSIALDLDYFYLDAPVYRMQVRQSGVITALSSLTGTWAVTLTADGGVVTPTTEVLNAGSVTVAFSAGPVAGEMVVTGTIGALTDTLFIDLVPGPISEFALQPAAWEISPTHSMAITVTASDEYGNPPLGDVAVEWKASGGTISPLRSVLAEGIGVATFTADFIYGSAVITAGIEGGGETETVAVLVNTYRQLLPLIMRME